jgi:hypothetical protein
MTHHARWAVPAVLPAFAAAVLLTGCGSGGAGQTATQTSSPSNRSSFAECLKKHGITLPSRPAGGGAPPSRPAGGGAGSAPPTGAAPGNGGQGFPGGARSSAFQKAIKACGGFGGGFGGPPG